MATKKKRPIDTLGGILDRIQDVRNSGKPKSERQCPATHTKISKRGEANTRGRSQGLSPHVAERFPSRDGGDVVSDCDSEADDRRSNDGTPAVFRPCVCGPGPKWACAGCGARHVCRTSDEVDEPSLSLPLQMRTEPEKCRLWLDTFGALSDGPLRLSELLDLTVIETLKGSEDHEALMAYAAAHDEDLATIRHLRSALAHAVDALRKVGKCRTCNGNGEYLPSCTMCHDSTWDHACPGPSACDSCDQTGWVKETREALAVLLVVHCYP